MRKPIFNKPLKRTAFGLLILGFLILIIGPPPGPSAQSPPPPGAGACLFAREVYQEAVLADCLKAVGYRNLAENLDYVSRRVQERRWQIRMRTGFDPEAVKIPDRFKQVVTWQGPLDTNYLDSLQKAYVEKIREMGKAKGQTH